MSAVAAILAAGTLLAAAPLQGSDAMKGPPTAGQHGHPAESVPDSSPLGVLFTGAITFYRSVISPTQSARCGFSPSCSSFGLQAVHDHGPFQGILMTADRLTRCNLLKEAGPDYYRLPNGRLFDPVSRNLLTEP